MQPKPLRPRRSDFASFDDYFDAMIEYHLTLSMLFPENEPMDAAFTQPVDASSDEHPFCRNCANSQACNLRQFKSSYREKICLILMDQTRTLYADYLRNNGNLLTPEHRMVWHELLKSFMQAHVQ